jgi:DNA-binding MurR/RpiR family transcriptional regulator
VAQARSVRATSILVTDMAAPALRPAPDIVLAAGRGPESEPRSLSAPMALWHALVLRVSQLDQTRTLQHHAAAGYGAQGLPGGTG